MSAVRESAQSQSANTDTSSFQALIDAHGVDPGACVDGGPEYGRTADSAASIWPLPRPMTRADLKGVLEVEQGAYNFPWSEGVFKDCLRAGYCCRVLDRDRRIDAYGIMQIAAGEAHILNLCVRRTLHGQGAGGVLLDSLIRQARRDAAVLMLEVRPTNASARRLYHRFGFRQVGRRRGYYPGQDGREDALVLSLPLPL